MTDMLFLLFATAKVNPSEIGYNPSITNPSGSDVANILSTVYMVAGIVAVLIMIIAGFMFVTSQGNAQKVAQARMAILAAGIGIIVIVFAFLITQFVIQGVAG